MRTLNPTSFIYNITFLFRMGHSNARADTASLRTSVAMDIGIVEICRTKRIAHLVSLMADTARRINSNARIIYACTRAICVTVLMIVLMAPMKISQFAVSVFYVALNSK